MSVTRTSSVRRTSEHFQPDGDDDPHAQRRLRGQLEQIDYTAYASNRAVISHSLGATDAQKFQRLAVAAAQARARWVAAALAATESGHAPGVEVVEKLALMRRLYEELSEAYEAMRRMVERGYLPYASPPA
jgi:long-subunit acyl-CoA synthetase (AMP-forming)